MIFAVRLPRPGDISRLSRRMRAIDVAECAAMGHTPREALREAFLGSAPVWVATINDKAECAFGVVPLDLIDGTGRVWMLGSEEARRWAAPLMRDAPRILARMHLRYRHLENVVAADNLSAIGWLEWLGFEVEPELLHYGGVAFRHFSKSA